MSNLIAQGSKIPVRALHLVLDYMWKKHFEITSESNSSCPRFFPEKQCTATQHTRVRVSRMWENSKNQSNDETNSCLTYTQPPFVFTTLYVFTALMQRYSCTLLSYVVNTYDCRRCRLRCNLRCRRTHNFHPCLCIQRFCGSCSVCCQCTRLHLRVAGQGWNKRHSLWL